MSQFFNSIVALAKTGKTSKDAAESTRAKKAAFVNAVKNALTGFATAGAWSCMLIGSSELDGTENVIVGKTSTVSSAGTERIDTITVGLDVMDELATGLAELKFTTAQHSEGQIRISWPEPPAAIPPAPVPPRN